MASPWYENVQNYSIYSHFRLAFDNKERIKSSSPPGLPPRKRLAGGFDLILPHTPRYAESASPGEEGRGRVE